MAERQKHGLDFENWVRETFTTNQKLPPTAEWDIANPNYRKKYEAQTMIYGNRPVSIKARKDQSDIYLGDALRQYNIKQEFLLIVGSYRQAGNKKIFYEVSVSLISPVDWHELFAEAITPGEIYNDRLSAEEMGAKIRDFDDLVSDKQPHYKALRKMAKEAKKKIPKMEIRLDQKIGSDGPGKAKQRRLQCRLPYYTFYTKFRRMLEVHADGRARLWGETIPDL
jgi:hypothetical protein